MVGSLVGVCLGLFLLYRFDPVQNAFYPQCAFHWFSGLSCPGCGALRATHSLLHGQLLTALRFNPLFCLLLVCGAWYGLRAVVRRLGGPSLPHPFRHPAWAWLLVGLITVFWVVRNLPLLAPGH